MRWILAKKTRASASVVISSVHTLVNLEIEEQRQENFKRGEKKKPEFLEKQNIDLKDAIENIKTQKSKNIDRWLNPLISAGISILVAFVAIKIGLK